MYGKVALGLTEMLCQLNSEVLNTRKSLACDVCGLFSWEINLGDIKTGLFYHALLLNLIPGY